MQNRRRAVTRLTEIENLDKRLPEIILPSERVDFILPIAAIEYALVLFTMVPEAVNWFNVRKQIFPVIPEVARQYEQ